MRGRMTHPWLAGRGIASFPRRRGRPSVELLEGRALLSGTEPTVSISAIPKALTDNTVPEVFAVTLSAASSKPVTVTYATADGTAIAGQDYVAIPPTKLIFAPGQTVLDVYAVGYLEPGISQSLTFTVNLSNPVNATLASGHTSGTATVLPYSGGKGNGNTVLNPQVPPFITVSPAQVNASASGTSDLIFTITLSHPFNQAVAVDYATADGSATAPGDYVAAGPTPVNFTAGQFQQTVAVTVNAEPADGAVKNFTINLSAATNASIETGQAIGTINDPAPTVGVVGDYNGSGATDLAVFRRVSAGQGDWYFAGGIVPPGAPDFGSGTLDIPFQGDLTGDGMNDLILYRPSTGQWFVWQSTGTFVQYNFGAPGDIPVVGDFDGVGHDELAVYQPSTGQWFVAGHATAFDTFGGPGDVPVPLQNYYGTGQDILAVFRPSTGQWFVAGQSSAINFGGAGDIPIPLFNYYGTNEAVLAVYRPSTSQWFVAGQSGGINFGGVGDVPVAGDFDGIGRDELGVFRPSTGDWYIAGHSTGIAFGGPTDIPLEAPLAYRVVGLNTAGIPASSLYAFGPGATTAAQTLSTLTAAVPAAQTGAGDGPDTLLASLDETPGHHRKQEVSS